MSHTESAPAGEPAMVRLCRFDELVDGESRGFDPLREGYDTMLVVRRGDRLHAWRDACPHINGVPMAWRKDAYLNAARDRIVCSAHGAMFDIETGVCTLGPCVGQALLPVHLTVSGGIVYVGMVPAPRRLAPAFACLAAGLSLVCGISAPAPAQPVPQDKPASTRSLPADNLPPFGMLDDQGHLVPTPPMPANGLPPRGPGSPPESTARGPSLSLAIKAARAAVEACGAAGYRVGASVVDSAGEARAMLTADQADGSHVFVAMRKALTAIVFDMASSKAKEAVTKHKALLARVTPNMFVEGGALPIVIDGTVIGAIGVSGAGGSPIGHQDEVCAAAGLRVIKSSLR